MISGRMADAQVRAAYAARSAEYIGLFGSIDAAAELDREHVLAWAQGVDGRIIDVGCGPGQWTSYLAERGVAIEGIDPVPELVDHARQHHRGVTYRIGRADRLDVERGSLGGVLAWFSLIHTSPDRIGVPLTEFARCIRPGGGLALGFFEGPELVPFDHAVATAYVWPVDLLSARVEQAGFAVTDVHTRVDPGTRPQGTMIARRTPTRAARSQCR